jgi:hypothetical protein
VTVVKRPGLKAEHSVFNAEVNNVRRYSVSPVLLGLAPD